MLLAGVIHAPDTGRSVQEPVIEVQDVSVVVNVGWRQPEE